MKWQSTFGVNDKMRVLLVNKNAIFSVNRGRLIESAIKAEMHVGQVEFM